MQLQYIGGSDRYTLMAEDLSRHGVSGFTKTVFDKKKGDAKMEVPDDAGAWLVANMPKDFKAVDAVQEPEGSDDGDDESSSEGDDSQSSARKPKGR